jgi:UPF0755 protein
VRLVKFLFFLIVIGAAVGGYYVLLPYGPSAESFVEIAPGTGSVGIGRELEQAGTIRSRYAFEALRVWHELRKTGPQTLKAGEYRFDHAAPLTEVYDRIARGDVYTRTVVIPEGYNLFEVAAAVEATGLGPRQAFLDAAMQHTELIALWSPGARSLEGYLFPDTYRFNRHATPLQMLMVMVKRFGVQMQRMGVPQARVARTVTMASLVEKEVHLDAERPEVASVFENRLAAGMPLQTDPAVVYASLLRGTWTGVIHQSELHSDSAYNTYVHAGLPPGPICNPGVAALKAALHPLKTEYLYFVADANGATRFAATLAEHNANVAAYRAGVKP